MITSRHGKYKVSNIQRPLVHTLLTLLTNIFVYYIFPYNRTLRKSPNYQISSYVGINHFPNTQTASTRCGILSDNYERESDLVSGTVIFALIYKQKQNVVVSSC